MEIIERKEKDVNFFLLLVLHILAFIPVVNIVVLWLLGKFSDVKKIYVQSVLCSFILSTVMIGSAMCYVAKDTRNALDILNKEYLMQKEQYLMQVLTAEQEAVNKQKLLEDVKLLVAKEKELTHLDNEYRRLEETLKDIESDTYKEFYYSLNYLTGSQIRGKTILRLKEEIDSLEHPMALIIQTKASVKKVGNIYRNFGNIIAGSEYSDKHGVYILTEDSVKTLNNLVTDYTENVESYEPVLNTKNMWSIKEDNFYMVYGVYSENNEWLGLVIKEV